MFTTLCWKPFEEIVNHRSRIFRHAFVLGCVRVITKPPIFLDLNSLTATDTRIGSIRVALLTFAFFKSVKGSDLLLEVDLPVIPEKAMTCWKRFEEIVNRIAGLQVGGRGP